MTESGVTYVTALADSTGLSAGYLNHLVHGNRPVHLRRCHPDAGRLARGRARAPREYRLRVVSQRLEAQPGLIDRLYKRLSQRR